MSPSRLPSRCREAGCPGRTTHRNGRCDTHQDPKSRRAAFTNKAESDKWYHLAIWGKVKAAFRAKYPERAVVCQWKDENGILCGQTATDTDHVVPHRGNWPLFLGGVDFENLQGLCASHHSVKTAKEDGGFGNG